MRTGLVSEDTVVALRLLHKFIANDSNNVVTMKMSKFEILYWNL